MTMKTDIYQLAESFILQVFKELEIPKVEERLKAIEKEINLTGTYQHTREELEHGVRMAWRNSNRCIGRLYWKSLILNDKRHVSNNKEVFEALEEHLHKGTNDGKILPLITVFPPQHSDGTIPFRIWNKSLIRYAAHLQADGKIIGDPDQLVFTQNCKKWGWKGDNSQYDILPFVVEENGKQLEWKNINPTLVLEVELEHPDYKWFKDLKLKWHALPLISDMVLEIGGILYPTAPFNGWYMVTEIGSRNLGDENRYNKLPIIAQKMGLKQDRNNPFWKDKALILLNEAVFYSFKKAGITITDHHAASEQFLKFVQNEEKEGRNIHADWSWIVPPLSGSTLKVFHQYYTNEVISPNFYYNHNAWESSPSESKCPFHISNRNIEI
jgi:nitric-oxide synthase, bacterial